jgi:drug/metabolite transporter (DMT)-like permease
MSAFPPVDRSPAPWRVALALTIVYLCWSTTYLAIQEGVRTMPPLLFGGSRITLAGLLLLAFLRTRGPLTVPTGRGLVGLWLAGCLMFLGGNGLINMGQKIVPSGVASVLVATCPLFIALFERMLPQGERLPFISWIGLLAWLFGVGVLALSRGIAGPGSTLGIILCLGSAFTWAAGSVLARHWPTRLPILQTAGFQMLLGGGTMLLLGVCFGEANQVSPESFTPGACLAFCWLLVVGSLVGFVAYVWLLGHTSAAIAGTYAYVNPALAILIGWALVGETVSGGIVLGLAIILGGVALVRSGRLNVPTPEPVTPVARPVPGELRRSGETGRVAVRV